MAVPKNLPNREIWAKEAINSLPPLAATEPVPPVEDAPLDLEADAKAYRAAQETPPARTKTLHRGALRHGESRGVAADEQRKPPSQRK